MCVCVLVPYKIITIINSPASFLVSIILFILSGHFDWTTAFFERNFVYGCVAVAVFQWPSSSSFHVSSSLFFASLFLMLLNMFAHVMVVVAATATVTSTAVYLSVYAGVRIYCMM